MDGYKLLFHVILLYYKSSNTNANNWTVEQWEGIVDTHEIIIDGEITTLKDSFDQSKSKDEIKDMDSFTYKYPNVVFTALKCKYSDAILDVLQTLYELLTIGYNKYYHVSKSEKYYYDEESEMKLLKPIINFLKIIKSNVVKIIYNLFFYWNKHPMLRTSEPHFLKSMLSINLFLYDNNIQQPYDRGMKNVYCLITAILQMINLLEGFRMKNCHVNDPYENYKIIANQIIKAISEDADIISTILNPKIKYLEKLIINGPFTYDGYNEDMYNPQYLLFKKALKVNGSMLENSETTINGKRKYFKDHYKYVISNLKYDLDEIFDYQILLIETITIIFFRQLYYIVLNSDNNNYVDDAQIVLTKFVEFSKKIIPSNCLTKACQAAKIFVNLRIYTSNEGKIKFMDETVNLVKSQIKKSLEYIRETIQKTDAYNPNHFSFETLIDYMLTNEQYTPFNQTVKLLSYEAEINSNYYILKYDGFHYEPKLKTEDQNVLKLVNNLCTTLFSFRQKLNSLILPSNYHNKSITESSRSKALESSFELTSKSLKILFYNLKILSKTQYILLPLLVYLHNESQINNYNIQLGRLLYLTINKYESFLLWLYKSPPSKLFLNLETPIVPHSTLELDQEISQKLIIDDLVDRKSYEKFTKKYHYVLSVYDYDWLGLWPDIDEDKEVQFFWNGKEVIASNEFKNFYMKMTMIDHQDLDKIQWLAVKWFLAKIMLKIKYVLVKFSNNIQTSLSARHLNRFTNNLKTLVKLKMPGCVLDSIEEMINFINIIITSSQNTHIKVAKNVIDEYLSMLGTSNTAVDYGSPENACERLETDIEKFKKYLNEIRDTSIIYSNTICFSTILFPV